MTNYTYISSIDKYLHTPSGDMYTDSDLDFISDMESAWKESLPRHTFQQTMSMFPEAIGAARRGLKDKLKRCKIRMTQLNEAQERYQENRINKAHFSEQAVLKKLSDGDFNKARSEVERSIKSIVFNLAYFDELDGKAPKKNFNGVSDAQIAQAKQVPIVDFYLDKLIQHGKTATGRCPFHNEDTASFTIYLHQNTYWCFGACQSGGSVVDFVMRQQSCDFLEAVKRLVK